MKHALLFLERNMGSGYAHAYPPLNPVLFWWLHTMVLPRARAQLERNGHPVDLDLGSSFPDKGMVSLYIGRRLVVHSLLAPDSCCDDPRARNPKFTLHAVFPRNLNFISGPFQAFLKKCRIIGWNIRKSGREDTLKVPIPDNLFLKK